MKRILASILALAMMAGMSAFATTTPAPAETPKPTYQTQNDSKNNSASSLMDDPPFDPINSPATPPKDGASIDEGMLVTPNAPTAMEATRFTTVYNEKGKVQGWANKGFILLADRQDEKNVYFSFPVENSENPIQTFYIHAKDLKEVEAAAPASYTNVSVDTITLRQGAVLYNRETGKRVYTVFRSPAPFRYDGNDDEGNFLFTFSGTDVYVKSHAAIVNEDSDNSSSNNNGNETAANVITGTIAEVFDGQSFMLYVTEGSPEKEIVIIYDATVAPEQKLAEGMLVKIEHNGIMTASLPPQMNAIKLTVLDDESQEEDGAIVSGVIKEVSSKGSSFLMETKEFGDATISYGKAVMPKIALTKGLKVTVEYDGNVAETYPVQITASRISVGEPDENGVNVLHGKISQLSSTENSFVLSSGDAGEVIVDYSRAKMPKIALEKGMDLEVAYEGNLPKNYPVRITAVNVTIPSDDKAVKEEELHGTITEISSDSNYFLMASEEMGEVRVNYGSAKMPRMALAKGQKVTVTFNGAATFSLPPQVSAISISFE